MPLENETEKAPVFDGHCDTPCRVTGDTGFDLGSRQSDGHVDIPRMREGGLNAQIFAFCTDPDLPEDQWESRTVEAIGGFLGELSRNEGEIAAAPEKGTISEIVEGGRIAALLCVEGGHAVKSLHFMRKLHSMGIRSLTITWKNTNSLADSSEGEERWGGLSGFGRDVVAEMDRLGMLIDCSHASRETFFDVIDVSSNPVIFSHSCMSAICDIPRNVDDEQLSELAANGGVACVNFFPPFLDLKTNVEVMTLWDQYRREKSSLSADYGGDPERAERELRPRYIPVLEKLRMPGLSAVVDHIDHAVEVAGIGHVGIGSDFDGIMVTPVGLEDVSRLPDLAAELERRGYSEEETGMIMGGNLARVVNRVCFGE